MHRHEDNLCSQQSRKQLFQICSSAQYLVCSSKALQKQNQKCLYVCVFVCTSNTQVQDSVNLSLFVYQVYNIQFVGIFIHVADVQECEQQSFLLFKQFLQFGFS
eukprot:TRINITY_DN14875_c0_g1_i3.p3 TRINITY_DN14875_c0_g1~~TRINITY_DN14875_c0_g1_i3.p3  ORF type:complete len:104 (-),score=1.94 TRINITY_DN14875_c0_g1_i3:204-515(-)